MRRVASLRLSAILPSFAILTGMSRVSSIVFSIITYTNTAEQLINSKFKWPRISWRAWPKQTHWGVIFLSVITNVLVTDRDKAIATTLTPF